MGGRYLASFLNMKIVQGQAVQEGFFNVLHMFLCLFFVQFFVALSCAGISFW